MCIKMSGLMNYSELYLFDDYGPRTFIFAPVHVWLDTSNGEKFAHNFLCRVANFGIRHSQSSQGGNGRRMAGNYFLETNES